MLKWETKVASSGYHYSLCVSNSKDKIILAEYPGTSLNKTRSLTNNIEEVLCEEINRHVYRAFSNNTLLVGVEFYQLDNNRLYKLYFDWKFKGNYDNLEVTNVKWTFISNKPETFELLYFK